MKNTELDGLFKLVNIKRKKCNYIVQPNVPFSNTCNFRATHVFAKVNQFSIFVEKISNILQHGGRADKSEIRILFVNIPD